MKKVFLQMMFGSKVPWFDQYVNDVQFLEKYGWYWKIFTPCDVQSRGNVEVVPMSLNDFDKRIEDKCGFPPRNYIDPKTETPHKLTSDYYPAYGFLMEEYIKGFDFWGHTNWDVIYGRLDHFFPDTLLEKSDIVADENNEINGPFTVYRNNAKTNSIFMLVEGWKEMFKEHELFTFDEYHMTKKVQEMSERGLVRFNTPGEFPFHGYDRFDHHIPVPQLKRKRDGSLYELFTDRVTGRKMGREISFFHFSYSKKYPHIYE